VDDALVTPEAVVLDLPVASVPTRVLAAVLDVVVQGIVLLLAALGAGLANGAVGAELGEVLLVVGSALLVFLTQLVYPTVLEARFGGTPGQLLLGLRVVTVDGGAPTLRQTATRTAVGILELEATLGLVALVTATVHPRGRRLGDLAAGTLVVRSRTGERTEVLAPVVPAGLRGWAEGIDTTALGPNERAALRRYLTRRMAVPPVTRATLAADLAARLVPRAGVVAPPGAVPDDLVMALAAVVGQRAAGPTGATSAGAPPPVPPPPVPPPPPPTAGGAAGRAPQAASPPPPPTAPSEPGRDGRAPGAAPTGFVPPA
jgi:uncharacterized RDD family membrane protein YckC